MSSRQVKKMSNFDPRKLPQSDVPAGSGGTSEILPMERAKASFDVEKMTNLLDGGVSQTIKRRWIWDAHEGEEPFVRTELSREAITGDSMRHFMDVHKQHLERGYKPGGQDMQFMSDGKSPVVAHLFG